MKDPIGREVRRYLGIECRMGMDPDQAARHLGRHARFGPAVTQPRFPEPVVLRCQIGHDQHPAGPVLAAKGAKKGAKTPLPATDEASPSAPADATILRNSPQLSTTLW